MNEISLLIMLRERISCLDFKLLAILTGRSELTIEIGKKKWYSNHPIKDKERELDLLAMLVTASKYSHLEELFITSLFTIIMKYSVLQQKKIFPYHIYPINHRYYLRVAFLGKKGSYSHLATIFYFSSNFNNFLENNCPSFKDIVKNVEILQSDYAIIPIENIISGSIKDVYDLLQYTSLFIVGEWTYHVDHCLLVSGTSNMKKINIIYSHPQPFQQCSNFIQSLSHCKRKYTDSTADAMEKVSQINLPNIAVIGSENGGFLYNLKSIKYNIANKKKNITRFLFLSKNKMKVDKKLIAKTTIIFSTKRNSFYIKETFLLFIRNNIIIIKRESLPSSNKLLEEIFYMDVQENIRSKNMKKTLKKLTLLTCTLKVLGCYTKWNIFSS